jgi:hypothetical protein
MIKRNIKYIYCDDKDNSKSLISDILSFVNENNISQNNIFTITFFVDSGKSEFESLCAKIKEDLSYHNILLPVAIVAQAPFQSHIAAEILYVTGDFQIIASCKEYKLIKTEYSSELYGVVVSDKRSNESDEVFDKLEKILNINNFEINEIIRQWNYIEDILEFREGEQNYQRFNNARSRFYAKTQWNKGYPAATGIGANAGGVAVCVHAVKLFNNTAIFPLKNPNQKDAHSYSEDVLVGGKNQKTTPKFERGKVLLYDDGFEIFISGTAAIVGENALKDSNAGEQTLATIRNIEKLSEIENINKNIPEVLNFRNVEFSNIRVYMKNQSDFMIIKQICDARFPAIPVIYLQADICRDELLVEIEGNCYGNILRNLK